MKRLTKKRAYSFSLLLTVLFILVARVSLININRAEWGDSYRILRASNFVQNLSYPEDEKRPPLFSALLAIRPKNADAITWGRLFMLLIGLASLAVFYKLSSKFLPTQSQRLLALAFLFLNPVYLYWSLRIYADVLFSLLVMVCFYILELWKEMVAKNSKQSVLYLALMGIICGLSILTRFEGYLLTFAVLVGLSTAGFSYKKLKKPAVFLLAVAIVVLPWFIYRNPFSSSYLEEPAGRKYDLEMLVTYLLSYSFVLGAIPAGALILRPLANFARVSKNYIHIAVFVFLESALILAWPAAIPRLFVPIIPFLIIVLVKSFTLKLNKKTGVIVAVLLPFYILAQDHLRLQFLGPQRVVFIAVSALSVLASLSVLFQKRNLTIFLFLISMTVLSASTIYLHKNIYSTVKEVSFFSSREAAGNFLHNDTAGIVNWYVPTSAYKNFDNKTYLTREYLMENNVDYLIITNEFNPNLEIDLKKRPYLTLLKESTQQRGGRMFFTWLIKMQK